jgi:hypothetical protein
MIFPRKNHRLKLPKMTKRKNGRTRRYKTLFLRRKTRRKFDERFLRPGGHRGVRRSLTSSGKRAQTPTGERGWNPAIQRSPGGLILPILPKNPEGEGDGKGCQGEQSAEFDVLCLCHRSPDNVILKFRVRGSHLATSCGSIRIAVGSTHYTANHQTFYQADPPPQTQ